MMVNKEKFRQMALAFPEAMEEPHFDKTSFRVQKKIFASYDAKANIACLKFSPIEQSIFCAIDETIIYPVPNKWGKQGWTFIALKMISKKLFQEALTSSYSEVAPLKLSKLIREY